MKPTSQDIREGVAEGFVRRPENVSNDTIIDQSAIVFAAKEWLTENKTDVLSAISEAAH